MAFWLFLMDVLCNVMETITIYIVKEEKNYSRICGNT